MVKKKSGVKKRSSPKKNLNIEKALVENFISLQKVMTNMALKFDSLSTQISKLLELFELSAKSLSEKGFSMEDRKTTEKIDNLLEQNKIIAKGVALLHESRQEIIEQPQQEIRRLQIPQQIQRTMEQPRELPMGSMPIRERIKEQGV
jgi:hypothetical protein